MTSQLNNSNENKEQVLQETETLRPVFFDQSQQLDPPSSSADQTKRARLDASVIAPDDTVSDGPLQSAEGSREVEAGVISSTSASSNTLMNIDRHHHHSIHHRHIMYQPHDLGAHQSPHADTTKPPSPTSLSKDCKSHVPSSSSVNQHSRVAANENGSYDPRFSRKNSVHRLMHSSKKSARMAASSNASSSKAPKLYRRFRSRSLPIINYTARSLVLQQQAFPVRLKANQQIFSYANPNVLYQPSSSSYNKHPSQNVATSAPSLPPINLQSLKEIDLQEILKNPQLRHDILFDPQLQFRPNLDGDRGRKKKSMIEKYWMEIERECQQFFDAKGISGIDTSKIPRLPALFTTLRDILLSLLPAKDRAPVNEIMDIDLTLQQFAHGSFDFVAMAQWLGEVFKSHCAPMRDQWVSEMIRKFQEAYAEASVCKLVLGLRSIFSILEAMKLDVANHQVRILRPVLIETAAEFERDYFNQLINHCKIDISDSLKWFYENHKIARDDEGKLPDPNSVITSSIIKLLSCRSLATEFPSTMAFDHTRLVLLRADVRQLVCNLLCIVLYKQLLINYQPAVAYRHKSLKLENINRVQDEILAIVTDDNGNIKWTRNIQSIAVQLVKNVVSDPNTDVKHVQNLPQPLIDFAYNWLIKQIQPSSNVYGLMESKIFKEISAEINSATSSVPPNLKWVTESKVRGEGSPFTALKQKKADSELSGIANRIATLSKFHWSVFKTYYLEHLESCQKMDFAPAATRLTV